MEMAIWLTVVMGVVPLVLWLLWWWNNAWYWLVITTLRSSKRGTMLPPGHMGLPILGETLTFLWYFKFLRRPEDYITSKRQKYGDGIGMYKTHLFGRPSVIAFLPSTNKFVLRDNENFKYGWAMVELVGKTSLTGVHGKAHLRLRSFVSRSINQPNALRRIGLAVQPRMISALQSWTKCHNITFYDEMKKVTFENIGMYFASIESGPTLDNLNKYFAGMISGLRAYPLNIPGFTFHHALQCRRKIQAIFKEVLDERRNNYNGDDQPINDLMDGLMNLKDEEGNRLSDTEVLDNMTSILLGGYESIAVVTMWAVYYLAKYPEVLQKLRNENMALKKSKSEQLVTSDEILKLEYTIKVVDETIRLANIAGFLLRITTKDLEYKGYTIPKGWNMILWLRNVHIDPKNFDDPLCFNPDRWNGSMLPENFQAFGYGPRICAGNMVARLQVALFLHHLSTGYKWKLVNPDAKVKYLPHPKPEDGLQITIEKL
ncbi:ent-kaurenoic acid oxidase 1 [Lactuca sativa]|uniref:Cytochrome P450 n=1 Tax=Lactuca sativa TaxID=4236 RepID=A0A9R1VZR7_LACSA|nr:ent-kaurenoic acid oxidase 1 [Lactuca sativa]KAJ0214529.1 hypothetical protein LSAT_V11C400199440 [Lactuca sativa]